MSLNLVPQVLSVSFKIFACSNRLFSLLCLHFSFFFSSPAYKIMHSTKLETEPLKKGQANRCTRKTTKKETHTSTHQRPIVCNRKHATWAFSRTQKINIFLLSNIIETINTVRLQIVSCNHFEHWTVRFGSVFR